MALWLNVKRNLQNTLQTNTCSPQPATAFFPIYIIPLNTNQATVSIKFLLVPFLSAIPPTSCKLGQLLIREERRNGIISCFYFYLTFYSLASSYSSSCLWRLLRQLPSVVLSPSYPLSSRIFLTMIYIIRIESKPPQTISWCKQFPHVKPNLTTEFWLPIWPWPC